MRRYTWWKESNPATGRCLALLSLVWILQWGGAGNARTPDRYAPTRTASESAALAAQRTTLAIQNEVLFEKESDEARTYIAGVLKLGPWFDDAPDPIRAALLPALRDARQSLFGEDGVMSAPSLVAKAILRVLTFFETTLLARDDSRPTLHSSSSDAGATPSDGDDHTATATAADLDWSSLSLLGGPSSHKDE